MARGELLCLQRRTWHWLGVSWRHEYKGDLDAVDEMLAPNFVNHTKLLPDQAARPRRLQRAIAQLLPPSLRPRSRRGPGSRRRQGGDPLRRAPHPRSRGAYGRCAYRQGLTSRAIVIHRIVEGKIAEEWGMGTIGWNLRGQRLEQERIERERIEQELRVARDHPAGITPQGGAHLRGMADLSLLPARP